MNPEFGPPIEVLDPQTGRVPLVISSPHSGSIYPDSLVAEMRLRVSQLRCLEDGLVDRLFGAAPGLGAPLISARFARAYIDPNREAFELEPELFVDPLPSYVNTSSTKARAGLGTLPSRIGGKPIYRRQLRFGEAERRLRLAYWPYHRALQTLVARARAEFGSVLLLDCHSMPSLSASGAATTDGAIDFALGDRFGRSCAPEIVARADRLLSRHGFRVARNRPYAGGYITSAYGRPEAGVHAIQIEIRRGLFMREPSFEPHAGMKPLCTILGELLVDLIGFTGGLQPAAVAAE